MRSDLKEELEKINQHHFVEKVHMLNALEKKMGSEAVKIAMDVLYSDTLKEWQEVAEIHDKNDIDELIHVLWEHFGKSGGYEYELIHEGDEVIVKCNKCPLADMAIAIGEPKWGMRFYCATDPYIVEGFNPNIGLERKHTLMEGHDHCDFRYYYKEKTQD